MVNKKFNKHDKTECIMGSNKGGIFIIDVIVHNGYFCSSYDNDGKIYFFNDNHLQKV